MTFIFWNNRGLTPLTYQQFSANNLSEECNKVRAEKGKFVLITKYVKINTRIFPETYDTFNTNKRNDYARSYA